MHNKLFMTRYKHGKIIMENQGFDILFLMTVC